MATTSNYNYSLTRFPCHTNYQVFEILKKLPFYDITKIKNSLKSSLMFTGNYLCSYPIMKSFQGQSMLTNIYIIKEQVHFIGLET